MQKAGKQLCLRTNSSVTITARKATTILDLNDDVLREIFQFFGVLDLCVVADVCSAFKRNAQAEYSQQYKGKRFEIQVQDKRIRINHLRQNWSLRQLCSVLRNFGAFTSSYLIFEVSTHHTNMREVMQLINQYSGETLAELKLQTVVFTVDLITALRPILSRLQTLHLLCCSFESNFVPSDLLSFCPRLITLSIKSLSRSSTEWDSYIRFGFPMLKTVSFESPVEINATSIKDFIKKSLQLKELTIECCSATTNNVIQSIAKFTPEIEELSFKINRDSYGVAEYGKCFKQLTALKSLKIKTSHDAYAAGTTPLKQIISELAAAHIPLERLSLSLFELDRELIDDIIKLRTLNELEFNCVLKMTMYDVLVIIKNLGKLAHFRIKHNGDCKFKHTDEYSRRSRMISNLHCGFGSLQVLNEVAYKEILMAVAKREKKCCLELTLQRVKIMKLVSDELMDTYQGILKVFID